MLLERMTARAAERDRAKLADWSAFRARVDLEPPSVPHTVVDALAPIEEQIAAVEMASR
jgi:hypothetical protein